MKRLLTKHVLITGASEGLGRQLALDFADESASSLALLARNLPLLQKLKEEIEERAKHCKVTLIQADLSNPQEIERVIAITLSAFNGKLDVLINNASTLGPTPMPMLVDYSLFDFQKVLSTTCWRRSF